MLEPGRRTLATTYVPGLIVSGTFGPTSSTTPKFSCPMMRKSWPGGAAPYSAALISLSVPSTPTRRTRTSTLRPWIFRILTNIAKTRAVRDGRTLPFSALQEPGRVPEAAVDADRFLDPEHPRWPGHWALKPEAWPEDALVAAETRDRLTEAIEALPATQRAVISLRDIEGWSSEEVRNALDLSETNQRVLLHRARSKVRAALESYLQEDTA